MMIKYTKNRQRLVSLIEATNGLITISDAEHALNLSRDQARRTLWSMTKAGWLKSIKSGLYAPVPLEASDPSMSESSPLVIANHLFAPCYIGSWTAANFWGLTDQLFLDTWVMTTKNVRYKKQETELHQFILTQVASDYLYGTKPEWIQSNKVIISDPSKTLIDFLNFPKMFSANSMVDILKAYMASEFKNLELLTDYVLKSNNKSIFKRLGFLIETFFPSEKATLAFCKQNLSKGYSSLSGISECDRIILKWNIKVPSTFIERND